MRKTKYYCRTWGPVQNFNIQNGVAGYEGRQFGNHCRTLLMFANNVTWTACTQRVIMSYLEFFEWWGKIWCDRVFLLAGDHHHRPGFLDLRGCEGHEGGEGWLVHGLSLYHLPHDVQETLQLDHVSLQPWHEAINTGIHSLRTTKHYTKLTKDKIPINLT